MEENAETKASRKEKRKAAKKLKRKEFRREAAVMNLAEEEARLNDPHFQLRLRLEEEAMAQRLENDRKEFEERERLWFQASEARRIASLVEEEQRSNNVFEEDHINPVEQENDEGDDWEYVEEGPAEIIWKGNEIIVKKKKIRVAKKAVDQRINVEDIDRPTSNPLPPQSEVFADFKNASVSSVFKNVAQQIPNFGTEQDKANCPFHIKTGACRFGQRCSRVHFYPDKSCTLLIKNMYNGPGLAWEQDEGLEYTEEEVERCYEEFYEDVHTEFQKFGELVNFKACRNGSFHLKGNVYVHYKSLDSAVLAFHSVNGRYFAGRQVKCEFVGVTRWKVAICGEYTKSRLKTCSRGTACNFIHCFRNPGGDYDWADVDKPPPKYWVEKMVSLFGYSDELGFDEYMDSSRKDEDWSHSTRSRSKDVTYSRRNRERNRSRSRSRSRQWSTKDSKRMEIPDEKMISIDNQHHKKHNRETDSVGDWLDRDRDGHRKRAGKRLRHRKEDSCSPENDSEERERHHSGTTRHREDILSCRDSKNRSWDSIPGEDFSNGDKEKDRWRKCISSDDHWNPHESVNARECLDEGSHHRKSKQSRNSKRKFSSTESDNSSPEKHRKSSSRHKTKSSSGCHHRKLEPP